MAFHEQGQHPGLGEPPPRQRVAAREPGQKRQKTPGVEQTAGYVLRLVGSHKQPAAPPRQPLEQPRYAGERRAFVKGAGAVARPVDADDALQIRRGQIRADPADDVFQKRPDAPLVQFGHGEPFLPQHAAEQPQDIGGAVHQRPVQVKKPVGVAFRSTSRHGASCALR